MASSALLDLQVAVFTLLRADSVLLTASPGGIFDGAAPLATNYPYTVVGEWTENSKDMLSRAGRELTITIHVFSVQEGFKQAKVIGNRIITLLDREEALLNAILDNWNISIGRYEDGQTFMETPKIRHAVLRFRYTAQPVL